jgi:FG-GAP-like repeat/Abnormal spindle-like microcephaly-assoc'd, ASPM-SPD-2-Hydin
LARPLRILLTASVVLSFAGAQALAQFETRASASTGAYSPFSLTVGDFNGDGKLDIAVVSFLPSSNVAILLGNGDGTFRAAASYVVGSQPLYVTTASLRGNGVLDLIVGDSLNDNLYVMLGNGDGTFQPPVAHTTTGRTVQVGTGDFNGDGKLDIIALTGNGEGCNCVEVLLGNGDGTFQAAIGTPVPYNIGGYAMATGYFNQDHKLDVAVSGTFGSANQVDILLGNGDGSFTPDGYYPVSLAPESVASGRFAGSNTTDLAVGNLEGGSVSVLIGKGNGTFQQAADYGSYAPTWVAVGDLNGDGKEDMVAANGGSAAIPPTSVVSVFTGNGDGTFQAGASYPAGESLNYVAIGDFNGDHMPDLVAVDQLGDTVITLLNTGVVTFSPTTPITFPTQLLGTTGSPLSATLTNSGTSPLTISSVSYSGKPFHVQTTCKGSIAPGGSCTITATFTAQAVGVTTGTVTIHDSASSKPQVVELVGTATAVKLSPAQLTFPPQKNGSKSSPQKILLTNVSNSPFDFTRSMYIDGTDPTSFYESNNCPTTLNGGASCSIHVIFAPRKTGSLSGSVIITDTGGGSPQSVPLTGTGD